MCLLVPINPYNNAYYCNLSVPLTNDSGNGQIADLESGAGFLSHVAGLIGKKEGGSRSHGRGQTPYVKGG